MEINGVVEGFGIEKIALRSPKTATDTALTESAMLEFTQSHQFETIMIQATSPLLTANDIDGGSA